jgi:hypothetical protein
MTFNFSVHNHIDLRDSAMTRTGSSGGQLANRADFAPRIPPLALSKHSPVT